MLAERIRARVEQAVTDQVFPGCVVGVVKKNESEVIPVGRLTYDASSLEVTSDTVYDVASITKSIPVSSLALSLIDSRKLFLDEPVKKYIPELHMRDAEKITPWHLLTHTLEYRLSLSSLKEKGADAILTEIFSREFSSPPGEKMNYTNAPSILLGLVIERKMDQKLDELAQEIFFTPLEMKNTTFHPEHLDKERIAPTEDDPWRGRIIQGEIHDESAFVLREKMIAGSAGVVSTVPDLLTFLQMLINEGEYKGKRYFSKEMIAAMQENQVAALGDTVGLGWELSQKRFMGEYASENTIGKTGFTGCVVMCDVPKQAGVVILSNYHFPKRKESVVGLNDVRRDIANIVFSL